MAKKDVSTRKKVVCSLSIAAASLLLIFTICGGFFNSWLKDVANFFVGTFGMTFYGMMIAVIVICSCILAGKTVRMPVKYVLYFCLLAFSLVMLINLFTTITVCYPVADGGKMPDVKLSNLISFSQYATYVYHYYSGFPTMGGIVFGTLTYGLQRITTVYGAAILLFGALGWAVYGVGVFFYCYFTGKITLAEHVSRKEEKKKDETPNNIAEPVPEVDDDRARALKILFDQSVQNEEVINTETYNSAQQSRMDNPHVTTRRQAEEFLFNSGTADDFFRSSDEEIGVKGYFNNSEEQPSEPAEPATKEDNSWRISRPAEPVEPVKQAPAQEVEEDRYPASDGWITEDSIDKVEIVDVVAEDKPQPAPQPVYTPVVPEPVVEEPQSINLNFDYQEEEEYPEESFVDKPFVEPESEPQPEPEPVVVKSQPAPQVAPAPQPEPKYDGEELLPIEKQTAVEGGIQMGFDFRTKDELREAQAKIHKYPKYITPPADLLNDATIVEDDDGYYREQANKAIVNKLAVYNIKVEAVEPVVGPTVTQYRFKVLSEKTRMNQFAQYTADLKACLEARDEIRIEAPIEGTNLVGIEAANKVRTPVVLRTLLESKEYKEKKGSLIFPIGQEISGNIIVADLAKTPHLLVAGTTGSGKSVFLHSMIASLMYRYGPEYLRFIMVDPKFVELTRYNGIPHMLTTETILNATDALAAMDYLVAEMESRYQLFRQAGAVNISDYNARINPKLAQKMPYLVLIVDELADLMATNGKNFEAKLQRLAQKSRAAGIHMVLATQRPDVKTVTGTIKANLPTRIALKVLTSIDSGTVLGYGGAEKLLGNGDMLYMSPDKATPTRTQGAYISDDEIRSLVEFASSQNEVYYDAEVSKEIFVSARQEQEAAAEAANTDSGDQEDKLDPYCKKALRFWLERQGGRASIASIQRGLNIGFNRAGRIMETLQRLHYVESLADNEVSGKKLKVLVSIEELDTLFPDMEG